MQNIKTILVIKKIKNTKKNNKKKIDINNADSDDIFEKKVTSKVSKIRKEIQATQNITSNELVTCSKNVVFMEFVHNFVMEYKGNCQNESMINCLPKIWPFEFDFNVIKKKD